MTAERRLPLDGADNFRDLGGCRTADERFVRWGVLFRSNDLADFTDADLDYLSEVDIRLQCDLRSDIEREKMPNRVLLTPVPEILEYPIPQAGMNPSEIQEAIRTGTMAELDIRQIMLSTYRSFPIEHRDLWARIFSRLQDPNSLPFLVHCTAGKDRTGFISALVLLGVPEQTVYEDYLAANRYRATYNNFVLRCVPLYSLFRTERKELLVFGVRGALRVAQGGFKASIHRANWEQAFIPVGSERAVAKLIVDGMGSDRLDGLVSHSRSGYSNHG